MPTPQSLDHMALEHDPNSARRKRRKTEDVNQRTRDPSTEGEPHQGDNSLLLDQPLATLNTPSGEIQFAANAGASNATLPPVVSDVASSESSSGSNSASDLHNPDRGVLDDANQALQSRSPPQKIMKLTANGKLLSSPVAKQSDDTPQKKRRSKRTKAGSQGLEQGKKKLVVLKYASEPDKNQNIGQLIDKIICGQTRYIPSRATVPPLPVAQNRNLRNLRTRSS